MSAVWKMPDKKVLVDWIEQCIEVSDLSDWERNFVESISDQLTSRGTLSQKQCEILEKIYSEKTK